MDENNGLLLNDKAFIEKDKQVALLSYMKRCVCKGVGGVGGGGGADGDKT